MKRNLKVAFVFLIIAVLLILSATSINSVPVDFSKLDAKYQYVYKVMTTKTLESDTCMIAELVNDSDEIYCEFKVVKIICGECDDDVIRVRLPKKDTDAAYQESGNDTLYSYFHFLKAVDTREKITCDFKLGEKYLLCLSGRENWGKDVTFEAILFLNEENYPLNESDINNPEGFVLMSDYLKYVAEKIGYNQPEKYYGTERFGTIDYESLEKDIRKYCGFSIFDRDKEA